MLATQMGRQPEKGIAIGSGTSNALNTERMTALRGAPSVHRTLGYIDFNALNS